MATRDLTRSFVKLREEARAKSVRRRDMASTNPFQSSRSRNFDNQALINKPEVEEDLEKGGEVIQGSFLPPLWVDSVEQVNADIAQIKQRMEQLNQLHAKRLMISFDDESESREEAEIGVVTQEITGVFRHAEKILQQKISVKSKDNADEAKTRQNVQRALATQLQTLSLEFRKSQKEYLARVQTQKQGPSDFDFLAKQPKTSHSTAIDSGFTQAQLLEMEIAEDLINERDEEIGQIAESISELATIFKELAVLVIDQGTILDRIDYNMEQVVERVEKGLEELETAEKIQKSSRPMKCIGILLSLICLMTAILVLKHTS